MFKKMFPSLYDPSKSLQERCYRLMGMIGAICLSLVTTICILNGEGILNIIALIIGTILFCVLFFLSLRINKTQLVGGIMGVLMLIILFPATFFGSGGVFSSTQDWFIFAAVYICVMMNGKLKIVFFVLETISFSVCYYLAWRFPELVSPQTERAFFIDSYTSIILICVLICSLLSFQISVYKEQNEISEKRRKEIEELNKSQNRFFSNMSHEIRTPINTIIGLNEMILRETKEMEVIEDAEKIQGASRMLLSIINDILDMSKIESGKMEIVEESYNTGEMFSELVNMIWSRTIEKGLEFRVEIDESIPAGLYGDEVRIKQILINLLNNAVKYTKEGSVVFSVQCEKKSEDKAEIIYTVTDTGIGIKKENMPMLFNIFQRVDEEKIRHIEGTGLGLSIVKQLVDLMGGEVTVNSVYTKGSTFIVRLPQEISDEKSLGRRNYMKGGRGHRSENYYRTFVAPDARVLIVDDNEVNLEVEKKLLRDTKVMVDTAGSGEECLELTINNKYDVIFMDYLMPEMNGVECLRRVREQAGGLNKNTPMVVLTANAGSENYQMYRKSGFEDYLLKPVTGKQLEESLLKHLPSRLVSGTGVSVISAGDDEPITERHHRRSVCITTESACDLPEELIIRNHIAVIPYRVKTEEGSFLDKVEADTHEMVYYMEETGKKVCSKAPTVDEYEQFFGEQLDKSHYIIHISMAKGVGKGYRNAMEAAKAFGNVAVIDSGHLSSGMGLLSIEAARLANENVLSAEQICEQIESIKKRVNTSFIIRTTEKMSEEGYISTPMHKLADAILLHPSITLKSSKMNVGKIFWGYDGYVARKYVRDILKKKSEMDRRRIFVTYVSLSESEKSDIKDWISNEIKFNEIIFQQASPAISVNCGPGAFGLIYLEKQKEDVR